MRASFVCPLPHFTSPISKLPVELLSHVFNLTTHAYCHSKCDHWTYEAPFSPDSVSAPTKLASVSRHWRHVALSTPSIWTTLSITVDNVIMFGGPSPDAVLDVRHLAVHISRSGNLPVDIFIDARDIEWDFTEPGGPDESQSNPSSQQPFSSDIMTKALDVLLPQLYRWHSLTILTDTWAPMYAAVNRLATAPVSTQPFGTHSPAIIGAPHLDSLTLMRCNEYVIHSSDFYPQDLEGPIHAPFTASFGENQIPLNILPRVRSLNLSGVHVNWSSLQRLISGTTANNRDLTVTCGLRTLEFSFHCYDVRPTHDEFCRILKACPDLRKLILKGSGPRIYHDGHTNSVKIVNLLFLEELEIAYLNADEAMETLHLIHAPNLKKLTIEDVSHLASATDEDEDEDGGCLLTYSGTGVVGEEFRMTSPVSSDNMEITHSFVQCIQPPFPSLEQLNLKRVKACPEPFKALLQGLSKLRHLSLSHTPLYAIEALLPPQGWSDADVNSGSGRASPCPSIESLDIFGAGSDAHHIIGYVMNERFRSGLSKPCNVELHFANEIPPDAMAAVTNMCGYVKLSVTQMYTGSYTNMGKDMVQDPYAPGGAFNDAEFDAFYAQDGFL